MSTTLWSAQIESVRAHLPGILSALEDLEKLNLTAEIRSELNRMLNHFNAY